MNESYVIAIERPGMGDIPETARASSPEIAAALVRALLECRDSNIRCVKVQIERVVSKAVAV